MITTLRFASSLQGRLGKDWSVVPVGGGITSGYLITHEPTFSFEMFEATLEMLGDPVEAVLSRFRGHTASVVSIRSSQVVSVSDAA